MCVFESKMWELLINTYLKALRKEKVIMWVNWLTVIITLGTTGVCVYICNSLTFSIASLAVLFGIRCMVSELVLARILHIRVFRDVILEFMLALIFIVVSWNVQSWWCMAIYFMAYIIYLFLHKQEMYGIWAKLKPNFIERHRY